MTFYDQIMYSYESSKTKTENLYKWWKIGGSYAFMHFEYKINVKKIHELSKTFVTF